MQYRIALVDDHVLIAKAIAGIINNFISYTVLYEAEHGKALMEKFKNPKNIPDIVLLDISMPVMDGYETARWIRRFHPDVLILALSMQDDEQSLLKMIKAGANGYLLKNIHPLELEQALDVLVTKKFYFPEWAASKIFNNITHDVIEKEINLTDKETEFLRFCCTEMSYKEISEKMFCSSRTVEGYRDIIFNKTGLKTRVGLAVFAIKMGIYDPRT